MKADDKRGYHVALAHAAMHMVATELHPIRSPQILDLQGSLDIKIPTAACLRFVPRVDLPQQLASFHRRYLTLTYSRKSRSLKLFIAISILVTGLVITLMLWFVQKLPIDAAMKQMAHIVVVVVGVIALLHYLDLI
ncbi:hypothetical protein ASD01_26915 [Ensifer sp. Root423]|nr:Thivi_2564 family membrane protein [Ensifer sp. Root423]KQX24717.1 hypothetical protein ASD01_26915 [Ensifer sp. Root423]